MNQERRTIEEEIRRLEARCERTWMGERNSRVTEIQGERNVRAQEIRKIIRWTVGTGLTIIIFIVGTFIGIITGFVYPDIKEIKADLKELDDKIDSLEDLVRVTHPETWVEKKREELGIQRTPITEISPLPAAKRNKAEDILNSLKENWEILKEKNLSDDAYYGFGLISYSIEDFDFALEVWNFLLNRNPKEIRALNGVGLIHNQKGEYKRAISILKRAVEINPDFIDPLNNLGWAYNGVGRYEEAETILKNVIVKEENYKYAYVNLSWTYIKTQRLTEARRVLERALEIDSGYAKAHYNLVCVNSLEGNVDEAIKHLEEAVKFGFDNYELIETDPDCKKLREDSRHKERYKDIINNLKKRKST